MLVPQNRLLGAVAAVILPLAVLGGVRTEWSAASASGIALVLAAAAVDAWMGVRARGAG